VTISGIDTPEAITEAGKAAEAGREVFAVPYDYQAACETAAAACLGTPYYNWFPDYLGIVESAKAGTWQPEWTWSGPDWSNINNIETSAIGYVSGQALSPEAEQQLDAFIAGLGDGSINLWTGPIAFQDGTEFLAEGQTLDINNSEDAQKIWYMPQLFAGIEGQSAAE
jgi:simple sugar transport system substrate-binding protein